MGYPVEQGTSVPSKWPWKYPYNLKLGQCPFGRRKAARHDSGENGLHRMSKNLQQLVERAVAQVLNHRLPQLQAELVERVLAEMPSAPTEAGATAGGGTPAGLVHAISSIHAGTSQKEILRALLDAGSACASRVALFVVKSGAASGWQARGFGDDEAIKDFPLDMAAGPAAHAYQNRVATPANIAEMDRRFVKQFGGPENEQVLVLPLVLKDKVAALLYADGGADNVLDSGSLEVLVMATSAWLEVASLRKQAQLREVAEPHVAERPPVPAPVHTVSSYADPFASHSSKHISRAPEPEPEPAAEVVEVAASAASASAAAAPAADPFAGLTAEDADTHRKAQRFARLLVDEIKLYNQAKVAEGRRNKDLYDRLKEDIDKSRATFQKRYGTTAAASGDYFQREVLRSLAEDDLSVMGGNFKK